MSCAWHRLAAYNYHYSCWYCFPQVTLISACPTLDDHRKQNPALCPRPASQRLTQGVRLADLFSTNSQDVHPGSALPGTLALCARTFKEGRRQEPMNRTLGGLRPAQLLQAPSSLAAPHPRPLAPPREQAIQQSTSLLALVFEKSNCL